MGGRTGEPPSAGAGRNPLSAAQEQMWFLDHLAPGGAAYNMARTFQLTGPLDVSALAGALHQVQRTHDMLRAVFPVVDDAPTLVITDTIVDLAVSDLSTVAPTDRERARLELVDSVVRTPFDLAHGPLMRCALLKLDAETHLLVVVTHHMVIDGRSMNLFLRDLSRCYAANRAGEPMPLTKPPVQFADYAAEQRNALRDGALAGQLRDIVEGLRGMAPLEFPTDHVRPAVPSSHSDFLYIDSPDDADACSELLAGVRRLAAEANATVLMVLMSAFVAVLSRHTQQDEIVVGTASAGRSSARLAETIGPFMNTHVLRCDVSGDPTFAELVQRIKTVLLRAWSQRAVPFDQVVAAMLTERDPSRNPLFQIAFQVLDHTTLEGRPFFDHVRVERVSADVGSHPFDLMVNAILSAGRMQYRVDFATDLFERGRIERLMSHLDQVLRQAVTDPRVRVSQLQLMTGAERDQIDAFTQGRPLPQSPLTLHGQIAATAAAYPDAVAARLDGAEFTYGELDRAANRLAHRLRELGVGHEEIVAVALEKDDGFRLLVALLGVLKAGGAVATIDVTHPPQRLAFILADTAAKVLIANSATRERLPTPAGWRTLLIDQEWAEIETQPSTPPEEVADENSLAYVLYTSGSTGKPKGVMVEHHALTTFATYINDEFHFGPGDRLALHMSLIFDFSIGEIFTALVAGAALVFIADDVRLDPTTFADLLDRERITYLGGPPALLAILPERAYPHLKYMIAGGEVLTADVVNQWNVPPRRLMNGYGPTETAVCCIGHICEYAQWTAPPPIGRPMPRRHVYIRDRFANPCPIGVPGEIVIGGAGIGRGYVNLPEQTAQRFTFDPDRRERLYHTGDLGAWNSDGTIEFLGRIDTQVKLNGLRIELEEIETALTAYTGITAAAVVMREDLPGHRHLAGYVVPTDPENAPTGAELTDHLTAHLPRYMIPTTFTTLPRLPLTKVGKTDRAGLAAMPSTASPAGARKTASTPTEHAVATTFAGILALEHVSPDDNFFALGGNSIQAARAVLELTRTAGVPLRIGDFYSAPDVASVARAIDDALAERRAKAAAGSALANEISELERRLADKRAGLAVNTPTSSAQGGERNGQSEPRG